MTLDQVSRGLASCYLICAFKAMMKYFHNHFDFGDEKIPHDMEELKELQIEMNAE